MAEFFLPSPFFFCMMNALLKFWEDITWVMCGLCGNKDFLLIARREISHNSV